MLKNIYRIYSEDFEVSIPFDSRKNQKKEKISDSFSVKIICVMDVKEARCPYVTQASLHKCFHGSNCPLII